MDDLKDFLNSFKKISGVMNENYTMRNFLLDNSKLCNINNFIINYYKGLDRFSSQIEEVENRVN